MKVIFWSFCLSLFASVKSFANPACTTLCPALIGSSLALAKYFGVKNEVVGVLTGALLVVFGYWMIRFCEKRKWNFWMRNQILMLVSLASVAFVYKTELVYTPRLHWNLLYIDSFLLAVLCGALAHIVGVHIYAWMKEKNGGHAHFPFEKVVVPIVCDALVCWAFWGTSLCDCKEIMIIG